MSLTPRQFIVFLTVLLVSTFASAQRTTVSSTALQDASGVTVTDATISFTPVNNGGSPIAFKSGAGGQVVARPVTTTVTNGAFSISLADTSLTTPTHVCYSVAITDNETGVTLPFPGYGCLQPTGSAWSLDSYSPILAPMVVTEAGPAGQAATVAIGTVASGSTPGVTNVGSDQNATLNFTLQKGDTGAPGAVTANGSNGDWIVPGNTQTVSLNNIVWVFPNTANSNDISTPLQAALNGPCATGNGCVIHIGQFNGEARLMQPVIVPPADANVEIVCDSKNTTLARNYVSLLDEDMIDVHADYFTMHGCRLNAHSLIGQSPMLFLFGSHAHVFDNDFESYDPSNITATGLPSIGGDIGVRVSQTVAQVSGYSTDNPINGVSVGTFPIVYINKLAVGESLTLGNFTGAASVLNGQQVTVASVVYVSGGTSYFTTTRTLTGGAISQVTCASQCGLAAARPANDNKIDHNTLAMPFIALSTGDEANGTVFDSNTMTPGPELGTLGVTGVSESNGLLTLTTAANPQTVLGAPIAVTGYSITNNQVTVQLSGSNFPDTQRVVLSGLTGPAGLALNGTILTATGLPSSTSFSASYYLQSYFTNISVDGSAVGTFTIPKAVVGVGYMFTISGCPTNSSEAVLNGQTVTVISVSGNTFTAQLSGIVNVTNYAPPLATCGFINAVVPQTTDAGTALVPYYLQLHNLSASQQTRQENERYLNVVSTTTNSVTVMADDVSQSFASTSDLGTAVVYHGEGECFDINSGDNGGDGTIITNNVCNAATLPSYQESASGVTWVGNHFNYVGDQQNETLRIHLAQGVADRSLVTSNYFTASPWQLAGIIVFGFATHTSIVGNHIQGYQPFLNADGTAKAGPTSSWYLSGSGIVLSGQIGYTAVMSNFFSNISGSSITVRAPATVVDLHVSGNMMQSPGRYGIEYIYPYGDAQTKAYNHQLVGNTVVGAGLGISYGCIGCMEMDGDGTKLEGTGYSIDNAGNATFNSLNVTNAVQASSATVFGLLNSLQMKAGNSGQFHTDYVGNILNDNWKAASGKWFLCVDTNGQAIAQATACQ